MPSNATSHRAPSPIARIIGENIRRARDEKGLTQHQLALHIGARGDQISDWERGRHRPDRYLPALAKVLGRDLAWFYTEPRARVNGKAKK